ncbi:hypothetical protein F4604DRAFT_1932956 [Suillus subluteus]|nr:hypothetical protein F4604DRAFT_1932956 [Suillus subluteus]
MSNPNVRVKCGISANQPSKYILDEKELEHISTLTGIELEDAQIEMERVHNTTQSMGKGAEGAEADDADDADDSDVGGGKDAWEDVLMEVDWDLQLDVPEKAGDMVQYRLNECDEGDVKEDAILKDLHLIEITRTIHISHSKTIQNSRSSQQTTSQLLQTPKTTFHNSRSTSTTDPKTTSVHHDAMLPNIKVWNIDQTSGGKLAISMVVSRGMEVGKVFSALFSPDHPLMIAAAGSNSKPQIWDVGANPGALRAFALKPSEGGRVLKEKKAEG